MSKVVLEDKHRQLLLKFIESYWNEFHSFCLRSEPMSEGVFRALGGKNDDEKTETRRKPIEMINIG